jgi:hypothetical protein
MSFAPKKRIAALALDLKFKGVVSIPPDIMRRFMTQYIEIDDISFLEQ